MNILWKISVESQDRQQKKLSVFKMGGVSVIFVEAMQTKNCSFMTFPSSYLTLPCDLKMDHDTISASQRSNAVTWLFQQTCCPFSKTPHHADRNCQHYGLCQTDCTQHQQIKLQPWKACGRITYPDSLMKKKTVKSRAKSKRLSLSTFTLCFEDKDNGNLKLT